MLMRSTRRAQHLFAPLLAAVAVVGLAAPIGAQSTPGAITPVGLDFQRYGGADRYATSLEIAEAFLDDADGSSEWAVMVSGTSWPDAVVASSLAGSLDAPVLLTPPRDLLADTKTFLERADVSSVIVVGSGALPGVSDNVISELWANCLEVERISGSSPSATSVAVARRLGEVMQARSPRSPQVGSMPGLGATAIVASSEVFADALVSGPVSAYGDHPVLLTSPQRLDAGVETYLGEAGVEHVVLMGGTAALSTPVEQALDNRGIAVTRLAGATRFETAVLMAELVHERYAGSSGRACFTHEEVGLARARVPFDSFSAAPLLASRCTPLLLTDPTTTNTATSGYLGVAASGAASSGADDLRVHVFGGPAAISRSVLDDYAARRATSAGLDPEPPTDACGTPGRQRIVGEFREEPRQLAWTADCSRLLLVHYDMSLWIANGDGSDAKPLLPLGRKVSWAVWSPDEKRIALSSNKRSGEGLVRHIHVINADGSGEVHLTDGVVNDDHPAWSPDGRRLVIQRRDGAARDRTETAKLQDTHLLTMDADGRNQVPLLQEGAVESLPAWSPRSTDSTSNSCRLMPASTNPGRSGSEGFDGLPTVAASSSTFTSSRSWIGG